MELHTILLFVSVSFSRVYTSIHYRCAEVIGQAGLSPVCITLSFPLLFLVLYARVTLIRHHVRLSASDIFSRVDSLRNRYRHFWYLADCSPLPLPPIWPFPVFIKTSNLLARGQDQTLGYKAFQSESHSFYEGVYTYTFDTHPLFFFNSTCVN